jgi:hypothetical protein
MEKFCMDCGLLVKGRSDKKFCDDQCRTNYNNKLKTENHKNIRLINSILSRNRKTLEKLNPTGKVKISLKKLLEEGYNLTYHTHIYETQSGSKYFFCYEYGYLLIDTNQVLLVKREEFGLFNSAQQVSSKDE